MSMWTNKDSLSNLPKFLQVGRVLKINIVSGGTGYTNGATVAVTISAPSAGGVQATATANVAGGIVTSITVTNGGTKYTSAPTITMATGSGLDVVAVTEANVYDPKNIFFADVEEASLASNKAKGIWGGGWWHVKSYFDSNLDPRYKAERLIAMAVRAAVSGDVEDSMLPDVNTLINVTVQPVDVPFTFGAIKQINITVGGTGYTNGAAVPLVITAPATGGVQAEATANVAGGIVTAITVTNPGSGYTSAPAVSLTGGSNFAATAVLVSTTAAFSVTATATPSGTITYQWQVAPAGVLRYKDVTTGTGGTTASYSATGLTAADEGSRFRVQMMMTGAKTVNSTPAELTR